MEDAEICALIHELEEASAFNSCWRTSNYEYVSNLLMKAAETILALVQSKSEGKCK